MAAGLPIGFPACLRSPGAAALSANGLRDVIGCWYSAARVDESDPVQREWLTTCEHGLIDSLDTRPELRTLVSSPLLCALLCALYRQGNLYLPHSRRELLEAALDLLLRLRHLTTLRAVKLIGNVPL